MNSCFLIDWTVFAAVVSAIATSVMAYSAYMAHKFARGYFARVFVSIYLNPEDDIAEEENTGDACRQIVVHVENYDSKPIKIQKVQYYYKKYLLMKEEYKKTLDDIVNVVQKDICGVVIDSHEDHRYELNLAEVKRQAKERKYFYVRVQHNIGPKPVTKKLRLP